MIGSLVKFTVGVKDKASVTGYGVVVEKYRASWNDTGYPEGTEAISILCGNEIYTRPVESVLFIKEEEGP